MNSAYPLPEVSDADLDELRSRLRNTRWPQRFAGAEADTGAWGSGVPQGELRRLVDLWSTEFDWRATEAELRSLPWRREQIDGVEVGYLVFEGAGPEPTPVALLNGWPSSFLELVPLARLLAEEHDGHSFTAVIPALPGFPGTPQSSTLPPHPPTHQLWHRLMHDVLGFPTYLVHGGDLSAGTASLLAQAHPESVAGLHLLAIANPVDVDPDSVTAEERAYLDEAERWYAASGAYQHQQMTRPVTLSYGLSDSPVGLLAWILEKYHDWTDRRGDEVSGLDDDLILTQASLYWFTNAIATSFRPYYEYAEGHTERVRRVEVPTAVALFPADLTHPPRSWAERTYAVTRFTRMERGGHFAAAEVPDVLAADIRAFARSLSPATLSEV